MNKLMIAAVLATFALSATAEARNHKGKKRPRAHAAAKATLPPGLEILERDAKGQATKIRKDGVEMNVCTSDNSDGCINPREAGLGFGNNAIQDWPGREISREN